MNVLVAYSSKHGSTRGVAERIAGKLRQAGMEAEAVQVGAVTDLGSYGAAVIGCSVYYGSWSKDAAEFVRRNRAALAALPAWLFSVGPVGDKALPPPKEIAEFEMAIAPRGHHLFAGSIDRSQLNFTERLMVKGVGAPEGDFRNWGEIDAWAESIASEIGRPAARVS